MRRRSVLTAGAVGAAAVFAGGGQAMAATSGIAAASSGDVQWASDSLRSLASKIGLRIGTALYPEDISTAANSAIASGQFSVYTPANAMKWDNVEPTTQGTYDWSGADTLVNYAKAHGALVRGHTLCWHNQVPGWLTTDVANGKYTQTQLLDLLQKHIFTEVGRYKGKIWQWDVANEFLTDASPSGVDPDNWWIVNAGPEVITKSFQWAHEADPGALLFYNDYNNGGEDGSNAKFSACVALAESLQKNAHIDGIGIQGHLDTQYGWNPVQLRKDLEAYAAMGLKTAITEADVRTFVTDATSQTPKDSLSQFAQPFEYSEQLKAALAVPECISYTVWGISDANSWVPGTFSGEGYACPYDVNLQPKAVVAAFQSDLALAGLGAPQRVKTRQPTP